MIVCVDCDGTLTKENKYPDVGELNLVAINILKRYKAQGGKLILYTCREGKPLYDAIMACREVGLEFDAVNENCVGQFEAFKERYPDAIKNRKPYADYYIDDSAWFGRAIDWELVGNVILAF